MFKSFLVYPDDGVWLAEGELLLGSESGEIWRPAGTTSPQGTSAIGCRSFVRLGGLHDQRENRPRSPSGARRRSRARWWVLEAGGGVAVGVQHPQDVEVIGLLDVGDEVREPIHRVGPQTWPVEVDGVPGGLDRLRIRASPWCAVAPVGGSPCEATSARVPQRWSRRSTAQCQHALCRRSGHEQR